MCMYVHSVKNESNCAKCASFWIHTPLLLSHLFFLSLSDWACNTRKWIKLVTSELEFVGWHICHAHTRNPRISAHLQSCYFLYAYFYLLFVVDVVGCVNTQNVCFYISLPASSSIFMHIIFWRFSMDVTRWSKQRRWRGTRGEKKKNDSVEIYAIVFFSHFILITSCYKYSGPFITFKLNGSPGLLTNWMKLQYDHTQNSWYTFLKKQHKNEKMRCEHRNVEVFGAVRNEYMCSYWFFSSLFTNVCKLPNFWSVG